MTATVIATTLGMAADTDDDNDGVLDTADAFSSNQPRLTDRYGW